MFDVFNSILNTIVYRSYIKTTFFLISFFFLPFNNYLHVLTIIPHNIYLIPTRMTASTGIVDVHKTKMKILKIRIIGVFNFL